MKIPTLFKEYVWLIETIHQAGRIMFAEINEKWKNNKNFFRMYRDMVQLASNFAQKFEDRLHCLCIVN